MYITEKEMFAQRNPERFYDFQSVERLKEIYSEVNYSLNVHFLTTSSQTKFFLTALILVNL